MITTDNFEIKKTAQLTSGYVESELARNGIEPLRWAIVEENGNSWILSVSYECNKF